MPLLVLMEGILAAWAESDGSEVLLNPPPVLSILSHSSWDRIPRRIRRHRHGRPVGSRVLRFEQHRYLPDGGSRQRAAWKAVRASASLPALLAPVLFDGQAHVDGGLVDNVPTDVRRARTVGPVFAVSLG